MMLYWFPVVDVTNYHKPGSLKQENLLLLQLSSLEVWNQLPFVPVKALVGTYSHQGL